MQNSYCYTPGVGVGVRMQNVRANVKVLELKSFCIFSCILSLLIILIKPLTTKAYDRRTSGDCGTSGSYMCAWGLLLANHNNFSIHIHIDRTRKGSYNVCHCLQQKTTARFFGAPCLFTPYREDKFDWNSISQNLLYP